MGLDFETYGGNFFQFSNVLSFFLKLNCNNKTKIKNSWNGREFKGLEQMPCRFSIWHCLFCWAPLGATPNRHQFCLKRKKREKGGLEHGQEITLHGLCMQILTLDPLFCMASKHHWMEPKIILWCLGDTSGGAQDWLLTTRVSHLIMSGDLMECQGSKPGQLLTMKEPCSLGQKSFLILF